MLRIVAGVVLGYVVMAAVVFIGLTAAWFALGPDGAFRPDVYELSVVWIVASIVVGIIAALLGGVVSRRVSRTIAATWALAGLVLVIGIVSAMPVLRAGPVESAARTDAPDMFEAMQQARTPLWLALLNPLIGVAGVLVGGGAIARGSRAAPQERRVPV